MCRLFETIRIEGGVPRHLALHEARMMRTAEERWGVHLVPDLEARIRVPAELSAGTVRCNVFYERTILDIHFQPYEKKIIRSLRAVVCDDIDYSIKSADRTRLDSLLALRDGCDEIIIIKNGMVTDTSMSNLIFYDGTGWITPSDALLKGTCRERLLAEGRIREAPVRADEIGNYAGCKLINAMRDPEEESMVTDLI
jgi:4-amino-4-deoxychorismate lyase